MRLPMHLKKVSIALAVVIVSFVISLKVMDIVAPRATNRPPALAELPPLPPAARASTVMAPIAIALSAIRDAADRSAPRNFTGKADNPISQILQNADIGWSAARGPIATSGAQDALTLSTPLTGTLNVTGSLSAKATGAVGDALGGLLGGNVAKQIGSVNIKNLNASAEIKGNVVISARPKIAANWRIEPNLAGQVNLSDSSLSVAGARVSVPAQVKPLIDQNVAEQIALVQARMRNDPALEQNARAQWAKACRSIPLQGTTSASTMPPLWLEVRPIRAMAAQPRVDAANLTLTLGIQAETRVTPAETKPSCPFPATLDIVPPTPGRVAIGVPIDMPFTEINKLVEAQFAGKTFPEDGSGSVDVTVKRATVAASGNRLLISLLVSAREKTSFLNLGGEANVHIWGRPSLDQAAQTLRLTDIELAVESEAAFGLLGAAARAAIPHLKKTLAERATIDLKPFAANAQNSGKSTLLNILGGLDAPTGGQARWRDHDLVGADDAELTRYRREHVGFVFQFYNLIPSLTVLENVALVNEIAEKPLDPREALALVGLEKRLDHFPSQLSGGEQQRVAVARAIVKSPDVLLCDEPTGALDFDTGKVVLAAIARVNEQLGTTTVIITHNAAIAGMADRVLRLGGGRIVGEERNAHRLSPEEVRW